MHSTNKTIRVKKVKNKIPATSHKMAQSSIQNIKQEEKYEQMLPFVPSYKDISDNEKLILSNSESGIILSNYKNIAKYLNSALIYANDQMNRFRFEGVHISPEPFQDRSRWATRIIYTKFNQIQYIELNVRWMSYGLSTDPFREICVDKKTIFDAAFKSLSMMLYYVNSLDLVVINNKVDREIIPFDAEIDAIINSSLRFECVEQMYDVFIFSLNYTANIRTNMCVNFKISSCKITHDHYFDDCDRFIEIACSFIGNITEHKVILLMDTENIYRDGINIYPFAKYRNLNVLSAKIFDDILSNYKDLYNSPTITKSVKILSPISKFTFKKQKNVGDIEKIIIADASEFNPSKMSSKMSASASEFNPSKMSSKMSASASEFNPSTMSSKMSASASEFNPSTMSSKMSASAPEFNPSSMSSKMSANAPEFNPSSMSSKMSANALEFSPSNAFSISSKITLNKKVLPTKKVSPYGRVYRSINTTSPMQNTVFPNIPAFVPDISALGLYNSVNSVQQDFFNMLPVISNSPIDVNKLSIYNKNKMNMTNCDIYCSCNFCNP
jgi:hypothetical protein